MTEERVTFRSKGLTLAGVVRVPPHTRERRPAFIVLHGFGSNKSSSNVLEPCAMFEKLGYVTLRFDMPGCGESEGEKGRLICLDQVAATSDALSFLARHPAVEPDRIALIGSSFRAAAGAVPAAAHGPVLPNEQSVELFRGAGQPTDLHLFAETDHFMFAESNTRVRTVLHDWLAQYFPVKAREPVA